MANRSRWMFKSRGRSFRQTLLHFDGSSWTRSALPSVIGGFAQVDRIEDAVILVGDVTMVRRGTSWETLPVKGRITPGGKLDELWGIVPYGQTGRLEQLLPAETADRTPGPPAQMIVAGKDGLWAIGEHGSILHLEPNTLPAFLDRTFDAGAGVQAESTMAYFVDIDGAGLRDLALVAPFGRNSFLRSEEGGTFRPMPLVYPSLAALPVGKDMVLADMDGDGWVDVVNRPDSRPGTDSIEIWRNLGGFRFWSAPSGILPTPVNDVIDTGSIDVFDFDGDSDLDIYEVRSLSKFGGFPCPNLLHRNDGFGHFTTSPLFQSNGGAAWSWTHVAIAADFTGDGRIDIIAANSWGMGNTFYKKNETGEFVDATAESGLAGDAHLTLGVVSGDIDNDGALDVLVLTSVDFGPSRLYRNDGLGHFHDVTTESGLESSAPNRVALGARVSVFRSDGAVIGVRETHWRQPIAHFGVADASRGDVEVRFPSGVIRRENAILTGREIVISEHSFPVRMAYDLVFFLRHRWAWADGRRDFISMLASSGECRVLERGVWQSTAYLAMEFVEGTSLASVLSVEGRLPLLRQLEILRDAAVALSAAHALGILHRDVKPDNILLSRAGVVKLVDFGIAAIAAAPSQTDVGLLVGTIAYMPPERIAGRPEDARAICILWA